MAVNVNLALRIDKDVLDTFKTKTKTLGKPYQTVVREMIEAFNGDRISIKVTTEQKELLKIYQD